jgi:GTP-binding protein EngB required for normal cell division
MVANFNMRGFISEMTTDAGATLRWYDDMRMKIARIGQRAMRECVHDHDAEGERTIQQLLARLAEDRFNLAVVGPFSRGKSTLMNAMLGFDALPTGILPHTSVVTTVTYGAKEHAVIRCEGWSFPQEIALHELPGYVTEQGNPGNRRKVVLAEVRLPSELLRNGLCFVDTPGIGSAITANTETTKRYLPEIDAAIFVSSFDSPLTADETEFLLRLRSVVGIVFFVLNKADLIRAEERPTVTSFVQDKLDSILGNSNYGLFPISAKQALEAKLAGREGDLPASGLSDLERAVAKFLSTEKSRQLANRVLDRLVGLISDRRILGALRLNGEGPDARNEKLEELEKANRELQSERERLATGLRVSADPALARIEPRLNKIFAELRKDALRRYATRFTQPETLSGAGAFDLFAREVSSFCQKRLERELRLGAASLSTEFELVAGSRLAELSSLAGRVPELASRILNTTAVKEKEEERKAEKTHLELRSVAPGRIDWNPQLPWWIYAVPLRWFEDTAKEAFAKVLDRLLAQYRNSVRQILKGAIELSVRELDAAEARQIDSAFARVKRNLSKPGDARSDAFTSLLGDAIMLRNSISGQQSPTPNEDTSAGEQWFSGWEQCPVCQVLVKATFDRLSKLQYDLSDSELAQREHAEHGGFCSFHTWVYAGLASPQGISNAYPNLLKSYAARLQRAAAVEYAHSLEELETLSATNLQCPICRMGEELEERALFQTIASLTSGAAPIALCVPHLVNAARRCPNQENRRSLITATAQVLSRVADNMGRYSLKRDALRQDLVAPEERDAHVMGLSKLAGHKLLAKPSEEAEI